MVKDGDILTFGDGKGEAMKKEFEEPNFKNKSIELRLEEGEVCIYSTEEGLEKIINFCKTLLKKSDRGHIHLEDYEVLTPDSLKCTIAIFKSKNKEI
jgi:hypothetical protein